MNRSRAVKPQKAKLRRQFHRRRDALEPAQVLRASARICRRLEGVEMIREATTVAGYMPKGHEVDLRAFLQQMQAQNIRVVLPRVIGAGEMEFGVVESWHRLRRGAFGIEEPTGEVVVREAIDVFLVPGLVFDHSGHRLGFGKGYYDRVLSPKVPAIGIGYDWQVVDETLPVEPHDRAMNFIATDQRWLVPADRIHKS